MYQRGREQQILGAIIGRVYWWLAGQIPAGAAPVWMSLDTAGQLHIGVEPGGLVAVRLDPAWFIYHRDQAFQTEAIRLVRGLIREIGPVKGGFLTVDGWCPAPAARGHTVWLADVSGTVRRYGKNNRDEPAL